MAGIVKETVTPIEDKFEKDTTALLVDADKAWEQYKRSQGTRVTNAKELDAFLDGI